MVPPAIVRGELVSGNYFQTLGVSAALGRTLEPSDEQLGAEAVVVLDYGYWENTFGGSSAAIGRTIRLNGIVFTIVGVADPRFTRLTPGKSLDMWLPLTQIVPLGLNWGGQGLIDAGRPVRKQIGKSTSVIGPSYFCLPLMDCASVRSGAFVLRT
jgi:hypothetical protein